MQFPSKDILVLAVSQALTTTVVAMLTAVSALAGTYWASNPALSTLPVTATMLGAFLMIYPASWLMSILERTGSLIFKATIGMLGGLVAISLLWAHFY